ncbi:UDP-3-O-acyl-N-acetylglucosamine deacetylase [Roseiterribacter gracilis]|uniref:UDP-3-O-acyl-N-acetylglucosamine deacetylase n=1 Tax=Roseiterribacter gracilis TaxID=2812848 RepID=A0A8S8XDF9_9PROT|nr:UDP-3-O-acyl-N-acetylglucosamine deacetylase [Rhodospirillales bacterium TMPK1]
MPAARQITLKSAIDCSGVGLHSGARVRLELHPAPADAGIRFIRTDLAGEAAILPARWDAVVDTKLCTVLGNQAGTTIGTIEHLMAALAGLGIDNAEIRLDGPEVPIMDGSSEAFVFLLECAGTVEQDAPKRAIEVLQRISVGDDKAGASIMPAATASFEFTIDFRSAAIGRQERIYRPAPGAFKRELSRARTFGFVEEVDQLRRIGLARGASLDNAVGISGDKVLNIGGLRYADEFVRHKLLDAIGDLALAGMPLLGRFHGHRAGHAVNNQLLRALLAKPDAWTVVELPAAEEARFEQVRASA